MKILVIASGALSVRGRCHRLAFVGVTTISAFAKLGARDTELEALTVVLLAARLLAGAARPVLLLSFFDLLHYFWDEGVGVPQ